MTLHTHLHHLHAFINEFRTLFAKFGLPETIVTDNGTGFTSEQFKSFLKENGVKHITSAPLPSRV